MPRSVDELLSWIYEPVERDVLAEKYDTWASTYDDDLGAGYRVSPIAAARALARALPGRDSRILDAGAGTGLCGEELHELGWTNVEAVDMSAEMLAVSRRKGVYRDYHRCDLEEDAEFFPAASFDGIVTTGVITRNHAGHRSVRNMDRWLKPDGAVVVAILRDYLESQEELREVFTTVPWTLETVNTVTIFDSTEVGIYTYRKRKPGPQDAER
ncbi:class I SAM-dependent methyltransferase [Streptomyces sp. NA02950]|uniref:class I SAM-dependent DNA methyltransferase n=1 Tax=Streptomyces sp. NA02950 TaxID=2742137 RepID=UPI00159282C3|nr:class I SAM-dependent methyltransferase [Streptomyces sp. NA02950]QKV90702.1 class I SAM-dependent methyltransferase [Streptomyces sp. NA02950]